MGCDVRNGNSMITIDCSRVSALLAALDYSGDDDLEPANNLIECMLLNDWGCVEQSAEFLVFTHDPEEPVNWDSFVQLVPFVQEGSYFEQRPGDYVQDLQGNSRPGVMRASVEGGVLHCRLYALVKGADGFSIRQLIEEIDPQLI